MTLTQEIATSPDLTESAIFPPGDLYSDEPPLETELHLRQIILLLNCLEWWWKEKNDFYVAGNLTIYYSDRKRKNEHFRGPDFFVVLDTERKTRKSWVVWEEEGRYPNFILEILSDSTAKIDRELKKKLYQDTFRTPDYFWFDPYTSEFAGFHLVDGKYEPLEANDRGHLWSQQLGLYLGIEGGLLRFFTSEGELVPTPEEDAQAERQQKELAQQQKESERQQKESERQQKELAQQQKESERQQKESERQQKELAQQQKESERQQKESERQQKEIAQQKAERLAAKLRELNIDPDTI
ncbi:Uma2 family endonuclease [Lusitaniella coriacea LEGE 07157]|uniref:Uma2 family endonuclease n=1 Tax=Lusitaniella coriacea LEGE 07157 TaxID=945747 RepID=A0A8J7B372_9CYAN|nr:Uma2 family endonuclease [Lusitaniella coriacea]MBE9114842.1 Uma2 family endonuclease [Lusitaniella coriacea LEGE 07157]